MICIAKKTANFMENHKILIRVKKISIFTLHLFISSHINSVLKTKKVPMTELCYFLIKIFAFYTQNICTYITFPINERSCYFTLFCSIFECVVIALQKYVFLLLLSVFVLNWVRTNIPVIRSMKK